MTRHAALETKAILPPMENKAAEPAPVRSAVDDVAAAFASFKETNDERLRQIETRLGADVVTEEKLARIDAALDAARTRLDRIGLERARPPLADPLTRDDGAAQEHKAAFDLYVRAGESGGLKRLESKAMSAGSGPDGGYLAPDNLERTVLQRLAVLSPIRAIASVQQISGGQYKRAVSTGAPVTGWVAETAARPGTDAPSLAQIAFPAAELYAMPAATQTLLDDAVVNVEEWLAGEVETAFAEDHVPSTGEHDPYMHVFLDAGNGNVLAFFELPGQPEMGRDANTPAWVQHLAFKVASLDALLAAKAHLEAEGVDVLGPTHHGIFRSIYFFDPNGHRIELACDIGTKEQYAELARVAPLMLDEWSATKKAPRHADWLHEEARRGRD